MRGMEHTEFMLLLFIKLSMADCITLCQSFRFLVIQAWKSKHSRKCTLLSDQSSVICRNIKAHKAFLLTSLEIHYSSGT